MFNDILSEPMLENRELDLDFMSTFWDPLLSPNKSHLSGSTLLSSKINTTKEIIGIYIYIYYNIYRENTYTKRGI